VTPRLFRSVLSPLAVLCGTAGACAPAQVPAPPAPPPIAVPAATSASPAASAAPTVDESFRQHPPEAGPTKPFVPPAPTRAELRNHVPVVIVHQPSPYVAIRVVAARDADVIAPDRVEVLNQMLWSMHDGTTSRTRQQVEDALVSAGAAPLEIVTYPDAVAVSLVAPPGQLRAAVSLVADVALRPAFEIKDLERAREQKARAREAEAEDTSLIAAQTLRRVLFGEGLYGTVAGSSTQIRAVRRDQVVALHARVFDASRLSLVVAGDVAEEDAIAALEDAFGALAPSRAARARATAVSSPASAARLVVVDKPGTSIATVTAGFLAPAAGAPDADATLLAIDVLADSAFGRLTTRLRDELSYAPWVQYDASQLRAGGFVGWRTRVRGDRVAATLTEAYGVVRAFAAQGPSDEELGEVRDRHAFTFATSFQCKGRCCTRWGWRVRAGDVPLLVGAALLAACARADNTPPPAPSVPPLAALSAPTTAHEAAPTVTGLYTRACDGGSAVGCNSLALVYLEGRSGQKRDPPRAVTLFQRACDLGSPAACGNLGFLTRQGIGVSQDLVRAIGLLTRACDASWWEGCYWLADILFEGDYEDRPRALAALEPACKAGHPKSCASMGVLLQAGKGVPKDSKRAADLLDHACAADVAFACTWLGNMLVQGDGVARDAERARNVYAKGCTDDYPTGCYVFGIVCAKGELGDDYLKRADGLLKRACDHGEADACALLADRMEQGEP
jgi:TPR repeat protein/predicted Zn-dependent peptidase